MALTIQLLIKNNETTLEKTFQSILPLKGHIKAIDLGSKDDSQEICRQYGVEIFKTTNEKDYAKLRNEMLGDDWNFYIHPWEILVSGHEQIEKAQLAAEPRVGPYSYHLDVYQGDTVTREIRLWRDHRFSYPIFETILDKKSRKLPDIAIWSGVAPKEEGLLERIDEWKHKSGSIEPYYYEAWAMLQSGKYDSFITIATHYLSLDSKSKSAIMLRYYLAQVQGYLLKDIGQATRSIMPCVIARPLMAEFWCFLADMIYSRKKYKKAIELYTNAMMLGKRRPGDDDWPVEIAKYKEYPEKMIASSKEISSGIELYGSQKT
jgi:tetratricopeptide (TPR) repeat protein